MERRRTWLRLSLALNLVLLAVPLYLFTVRGLDLDSALAQYVTEHRAQSALGKFAEFEHDAQTEANIKHGDAPKHTVQEAVAPPPPPPPPPAPPAPRSCHVCDAGPTGKALCDKWGRDAIVRGVSYAGSNHRLRRALAKMRRGEPWTLGVLGGSVSTGHGLRDHGEPTSEFNMHRILFDHLNATFPAARGAVLHNVQKEGEAPPNDGRNWFVNGAVPARGSDYFAYCSHLHVPADADLVVLESAINDQLHINNVETFELLLRSLLEREHDTGVLVFNVFAFKFDNIAMGGDLNGGTTNYYDTPVLSARNAMLPYMFAHPETVAEWFAVMNHRLDKDPETLDNVDIRHFGRPLHRVSGELMVAYVDAQLCEMDALEADGKSTDELYPLDPLPPQRLMDKYAHHGSTPKLTPFCASTSSEKHPLSPVENEGWYEWSSSPEKKYLVSKTPGSTVKFRFSTSRGQILLYYLSSKDFGLGNVKCWVDGHEDDHLSLVLKGYWTNPFNTGAVKSIGGIEPGEHTLTCRLLEETDDPSGGKEFRFMSIMSI